MKKLCSFDGCTRSHYCKGFCTLHYQRYRKHGDPSVAPIINTNVCVVEGCDEVARTLGQTLCPFHYSRQIHGRSLAAPKRQQRDKRGTCIVAGCSAKDAGPLGYCSKHLARVRRNGSPHVVIHQRDRRNKLENHPRWTGEEATYSAIHQRLKSQRGCASDMKCIDCEGKAQHWSYTHDSEYELVDSDLGPYSTNLSDYVPRCVRCHKRFDLARLAS